MLINRRTLMKLGGVALVAPWLAGQGARAQSGRDILVSVFLRGGMDGLTAVPPYADPDYVALRPALALAAPGNGASAALPLDGFFGMHPSAVGLKSLYDQGLLAVVQACGMPTSNRSHFDVQDFVERGTNNKVGGPLSGWLGRHLEVSAGQGDSPFRAIGIGRATQRTLRGAVMPIGLSTIDAFDLSVKDSDHGLTRFALQQLYGGNHAVDQSARQALNVIDDMRRAAPEQFGVQNGASYPAGNFADQLRELGQLIRADIGLEAACIDLGGWDHHDSQLQRIGPLLQQLGDGLKAFADDMGARMANIQVVVISEFGRRAKQNANGGTEHGQGNALLLLGGGVRGGQVYGAWPGLRASDLVQGEDLDTATDYRTVLAELLSKRAGNVEMDRVFPDWSPQPALDIFHPRSS